MASGPAHEDEEVSPDAADGSADALPVCIPENEVDLFGDSNGDGFGSSPVVGRSCEAGEDQSLDGGDCDDAYDAIFPDAQDVCDGIDNTCNSEMDEDAISVGDVCSTRLSGVCASARLVCDGGELACVGPALRSELCNGLDDDRAGKEGRLEIAAAGGLAGGGERVALDEAGAAVDDEGGDGHGHAGGRMIQRAR